MEYKKGFSARDKFGNSYKIVGMKDKTGKGFAKGFIDISGVTYKVEYNTARKEGYEGWLKVTKMPKRSPGETF